MRLKQAYTGAVTTASSRPAEAVALALVRLALGGVFWRSGRAKMEEGSWFSISESTYELFRTEYAHVPLPAEFAAVAAAAAEHVFPALLLFGLATRLSALALLGMTMVIQIFVYPEAWWPVHSLWAALAAILIVRGGGALSVDAILPSQRR